MILAELIKKLEEINNDSDNATKPVKLIYNDSGVGIKVHVEIEKVSIKNNYIELTSE